MKHVPFGKTMQPLRLNKNILKERPKYDELLRALETSVKLQSHYANLLNMHDGGQRRIFVSVEDWILRLRELKELEMQRLEKDMLAE